MIIYEHFTSNAQIIALLCNSRFFELLMNVHTQICVKSGKRVLFY